MASNEEILKAIFDNTKQLGSLGVDVAKITGALPGMESHIKAVSEKCNRINDKLDIHIPDPDAHGVGSSWKMVGRVSGAIGLMLSIVALVHVFKGGSHGSTGENSARAAESTAAIGEALSAGGEVGTEPRGSTRPH